MSLNFSGGLGPNAQPQPEILLQARAHLTHKAYLTCLRSGVSVRTLVELGEPAPAVTLLLSPEAPDVSLHICSPLPATSSSLVLSFQSSPSPSPSARERTDGTAHTQLSLIVVHLGVDCHGGITVR